MLILIGSDPTLYRGTFLPEKM